MTKVRLLAIVLGVGLCSAGAANAQTTPAPLSDVNNEYRFTAYPSYPITDRLTGLAYLGYVFKPEGNPESVSAGLSGYSSYYLAVGTIYTPVKGIQVSEGLIGVYSRFSGPNNVLEWRPFAGVKAYGMNEKKWRYFNFTRYEGRFIDTLASDNFKTVHRVRSQFRLEIPFASPERAFTPKTTYLIGEVEPIYRSDNNTVDPIRLRGGLGLVLKPRVTMELLYFAQYTRPYGSYEYTDNIWRVNFIIRTKKGVLSWLDTLDLD